MLVCTNCYAKRVLANAGILGLRIAVVSGLVLAGASASASDGPLAANAITLPTMANEQPRDNGLAGTGLYQRALIEFNEGHHGKAVQLWRVLAEDGDRNAQFALGALYSNGDIETGIDRNPAAAASWYRRAAEQGHIAAQYNLGVLYASGSGVPHDLVEAARWWRRAALQGHTQAQFDLGLLYAQGSGVDPNPAEAVKWWGMAAERGYAPAQFNLGLMYMMGEGVTASRAEAVRLWQRSAKQGFGQAIHILEAMKSNQ
ncbi:MAG: tetratricopeptide repeat protein [Acidiferrobacterales bacterium]